MQILAYLILVHFDGLYIRFKIIFSSALLCHKTHKNVHKQ